MKFKLHHPWWTHLPAFVELLVLICLSALIIHWKLPVKLDAGLDQSVTVSYTFLIARNVGCAALLLLSSLVYDEIWARGEVRKTFNGFSMNDEMGIGMLLLHSMGILISAPLSAHLKDVIIYYIGLPMVLVGVILALWMERIRPIHPIVTILPQ